VGANKPVIWSVRLRSFNAIGNPNFEVDQRRIGQATNLTSGVFALDRWTASNVGTLRFASQQVPENIVLPGTSFLIGSKYLRLKLTTAQASLGVNDVFSLQQIVEGPMWRELQGDVHSISMVVRSSVPNLIFAVSLNDYNGSTATKSLVKSVTLGAANTWTLVQLPALPVWPSGNFSNAAGGYAYNILVTLAAGSGYQTTPDVWQSGSFRTTVATSNFAANAVNSTFDVGFVQHEPGPDCSTLIDLPFLDNLRACKRYWQKSYDYGVDIGTNVGWSPYALQPVINTNFAQSSNLIFDGEMAVIPAVFCYASNGTGNAVEQPSGVGLIGIANYYRSAKGINTVQIVSVSFTNANPAVAHWTASTGI
jgi:hypothetical protein